MADEAVRTIHLGQYTDAHADVLAERLHEAGIGFHTKASGRFTRVLFAGDWGVRFFVDEDRLADARRIADRVTDA